jgi:hypothetical protein
MIGGEDLPFRNAEARGPGAAATGTTPRGPVTRDYVWTGFAAGRLGLGGRQLRFGPKTGCP